MRENRNFKASDVSGPSVWIFILWSNYGQSWITATANPRLKFNLLF
jgi:hypothetical protein